VDQLVYLDYAAATPLDEEVFLAMQPYWQEKFFNPSSIYQSSVEVKNDLLQARQTIASLIGAHYQEIIFCAGGSEANNLALKGYLSNFEPSKNHVVVSYLEHDSVLKALNGFDYQLADLKSDGLIDIDHCLSLINDQTNLVVLMLANNEIGTIQPVKYLTDKIKQIRLERLKKKNFQPLIVFCDACQAGNYLDLHLSRLGVDMMSLNGSKIYGPKQTAALYIRHGLKIKPLIDGGGQEYGLRSGTENTAGFIGLAVALKKTQALKNSEIKRLKNLQNYFLKNLSNQLPEVILNGSFKNRLPNNLNLSFPGQDNERMLFYLGKHGIMASAGSACSASNHHASHVLSALGLNDHQIHSTIRITMGRQTTKDQLDKTIRVLVDYKKKL